MIYELIIFVLGMLAMAVVLTVVPKTMGDAFLLLIQKLKQIVIRRWRGKKADDKKSEKETKK